MQSLRGMRASDDGFSLVETIVATGILAVVLVGLAHLMAVSVENNLAARRRTASVLLAEQKLEQLRGLTWAFDRAGSPVTDIGLASSPAQSLEQNTAGFVDFLDANGRQLSTGTTVPADAAYVRRWAIDPAGAQTLILQVLVTGAHAGGPSISLVTAKSRKGQ